jgi:hypothetical protein
MRRWRSAVTMLGAAVLMAGCAATTTTQPTAPASATQPTAPASSSPSVSVLPTGTRWLIAASAVSKLDDIAGPTVVARYLDGLQTTIITGRNIPASLTDWHVNFALDTKSLQQIRLDVAGALSPRISMILYDPEHWSFTPLAEQSSVGPATRTAASIAHGAGRGLIVAPATDLAQGKVPGESTANAFIQTNDLEQVASSADWVEIQAQGLERNPGRYAAYINEALRQIRLANPNAVVYAGLSTNPSGPPVSAAELIDDVRLTSPAVTGYWLNIPSPGTACPRCGQPQPQIAIDVLEGLAGS